MQQNLLVATPTFVAFVFSRNGRLVTDKAKVSALGASNGVNCATTQVIAYIYDFVLHESFISNKYDATNLVTFSAFSE